MKKRNKVLIFVLVVLIILIVLFGTKLWLYASFLLGNDIIVKLEADNEFITIPHGEKEIIEFKAGVTTNPFCQAVCNSEFRDISNNQLIERDNFILKTGLSPVKRYEISSPDYKRSMGLYRFSMECKSIEGSLCHTSGEPTTRSILVTANFTLNEEEKVLKQSLKERIDFLSVEIGGLLNKIKIIKVGLEGAGEKLIVDDKDILNVENESLRLEGDFKSLEDDWGEENYVFIDSKVGNINESFIKLGNEFRDVENETSYTVNEYNSLITKMEESKALLDDFMLRASEENEGVIFDRIIEFSTMVDTFDKKESIGDKILRVNDVVAKVNNIFNISGNITVGIVPKEFNFERLSIGDYGEGKIELNLEDSLPQCCVFGECDDCCVTEECNNNGDLFPVVFLHGHAVSESVSIDYSLEGFNELQKRMEDDGYLNAGTITIYTDKDTPGGSLGVVNSPVTIRGSYYFDLFKEPENYVVVQRKSENIDTYAVRLKEVLDTVMFKTGKKKVNIVAFSMGGLVTRRYLQIFGGGDVDNVILLGTPNKGISGDVKRLCPVTGSKLECRDMNDDSLFINKLNSEDPVVEIHNIYGTGCNTRDGIGDGVVLEKNARLEGAKNYIIGGECKSLIEPFHLDLLKVNEYPKVYEVIKNVLED